MDYKLSFKSQQQFKTNTIYIRILQLNRKFEAKKRQRGFLFRHFFLLLKNSLKILSQARRSSTVDGGEVISEIEASNTMYTLNHVK